MTARKLIKTTLVLIWGLFLGIWLVTGTEIWASSDGDMTGDAPAIPITDAGQDDYIGSESCKACHEDHFDSFSKTKHAKLAQVKSWKGKVQGCESCHGPGKAHIDDPSDLTKIISFKGKSAKQISENCLSCHAGKESHSEFRRSDHWRNNVGCTDCHSPHQLKDKPTQVGSVTYPSNDSDSKPGRGTVKMLKVSQPSLCISCHSQAKAQFSRPFRHKVLEGQMNCSDCHNPHGGFELKNARLAVGADVACVKCHTDKQGPFVYEHLPVTTEGCATCHNTHGSTNPKMLKRSQVRQLCLECHSSVFNNLAPNAPGFHNITTRFRDCTICHVKIHGSQTDHVFFK